jgi:uncharacterized protein (UPF0264 family)
MAEGHFQKKEKRGEIMQKLLVSVRGPKEAIAAVRGGAHIADVEYPASALGTPYPLNIMTVRNRLNKAGYTKILVSTNIGEVPGVRATSCQAALGVATAGADIIKCGMAELPLGAALYLGNLVVRTVKKFYHQKKVIPADFVDEDMKRYFDPFDEGVELVEQIGANGLLIDTFNKSVGKGLLDYCSSGELKVFATRCHEIGKEEWIAGSITGMNCPCFGLPGRCHMRARAACEQKKRQIGEVKENIVRELSASNRGSYSLIRHMLGVHHP